MEQARMTHKIVGHEVLVSLPVVPSKRDTDNPGVCSMIISLTEGARSAR